MLRDAARYVRTAKPLMRRVFQRLPQGGHFSTLIYPVSGMEFKLPLVIVPLYPQVVPLRFQFRDARL